MPEEEFVEIAESEFFDNIESVIESIADYLQIAETKILETLERGGEIASLIGPEGAEEDEIYDALDAQDNQYKVKALAVKPMTGIDVNTGEAVHFTHMIVEVLDGYNREFIENLYEGDNENSEIEAAKAEKCSECGADALLCQKNQAIFGVHAKRYDEEVI